MGASPTPGNTLRTGSDARSAGHSQPSIGPDSVVLIVVVIIIHFESNLLS